MLLIFESRKITATGNEFTRNYKHDAVRKQTAVQTDFLESLVLIFFT